MINFSKTEPKSSTVTSSSFTYKKPIKRKATQSKSGDGYEHGEIRMVPDE